ncbi:MAG TPA: hypothetical protein VKI19_09735, partial [Acidimicrobiales bacterium]|nr:hypothetical protein [Acidimicrobiales bacterium]
GSLGLAALATVATARTHSLLRAGHGLRVASALTSGYSRAFYLAAGLAAAALACSSVVPSIRTRREPASARAADQVDGADRVAIDPA